MEDSHKSPTWKNPSRAYKIKKRALQDRLFEYESPTKRSKKSFLNASRKSLNLSQSFQSPLASDTSTCEDSTLMELLGLRPLPDESKPTDVHNLSKLLTSPAKFVVPVHTTPVKIRPNTESSQPRTLATSISSALDHNFSPLKTFLSEIATDGFTSPSKDRKTLVPKRMQLSPSCPLRSKSFCGRKSINDLLPPTAGGPGWHKDLCLDWSLKSSINIISPNSYGWCSNNLKTSEESSGISAFVRCIDIEPPENSHSSFPSTGSSQLDTSLGAQFHQCCLHWQHPSIPSITLFPREQSKGVQKQNIVKPMTLRFDKNTLDLMYSEWADAFQSAFKLLKARQCPFFYICANNFTCLFCSAGTQGDEQIQIYITPTTRKFREALDSNKINFTLPYDPTPNEAEADDADRMSEGSDIDEEEIQKLRTVAGTSGTKVPYPKDQKHLDLLLISGSDSLTFCDFLIKNKSLLIASSGPLAGIPPTILSPVAFHGATLKTLQVEQRKVTVDTMPLNCIDMKGPILPHVLHMLTSLLNKTVKSYKVKVKTLESTVPLNLYSKLNQIQGRVKSSAFDVQNLSDCGLKRGIVEAFCRSDNCDTIKDMLEGKRGMYRWQ